MTEPNANGEKRTCEDGHPLSAVTLDSEGGIACSACGSRGREALATVHPGGEACRSAGCHPTACPTCGTDGALVPPSPDYRARLCTDPWHGRQP